MTTQSVEVNTETVREAARAMTEARCGEPWTMPDVDNPDVKIRICGPHDMHWPDGRPCCRKYDDLTAALMSLATEVVRSAALSVH